MKSAAFAHYTDMPLTLVGFGLFIAVFVGVVIWTSLTVNKQRYKRFATELLNDGEPHE